MSINLPGYLVRALGILGFQWPDIDEDQIREAATHLRAYARDARQSIEVTHRTVTVDLAESYSSGAYETLALSWASKTRGHMETLCECAETFATALDATAVGVEVMKAAVIVQLGIALDEFIAAQALALETLGASEVALGALLAVQNRIIAGIISQFEAEFRRCADLSDDRADPGPDDGGAQQAALSGVQAGRARPERDEGRHGRDPPTRREDR